MDVRIFAVLPFLNVIPSFAQFSSMSTDYAGQRLFFTTELSQTGSGQPDYGKLFVADWRGVQPLLIYPYVELSTHGLVPGQPGLVTSDYSVDGVDLSSNGAYVSVIALRVCQGLTSGLCGYAEGSTLYDANGQIALQAAGRIIVSPSGKWALGVGNRLTGETVFTLYDLGKGTSYVMVNTLTSKREWSRHDIADDGTAVIATDWGVSILRAPSSIQALNLGVQSAGIGKMGVQSAVIDAAGKTIVWDFGGLHVVRTGDLSHPVAVGGPADFQPRISDDGSRILFLSPIAANNPQVFVMNTDGSGRRAVTAEPDGIASAVLSGDGQVAWALTRTGRLLKFDIGSGGRTQYTEPLAAFLRDQYFPGTQLRPYVVGTPGGVLSVPASVMPGEKVEITIDGRIAPVVRSEPQTAVFQIPWTTAAPSDWVHFQLAIRQPDSPSWSGNTLDLYLFPFSPLLLTGAHQDFSALITADNPARAGEIVHLFGTGFGPVTPSVPEGPAPIATLSRTVNPVTCSAAANSVRIPATVLFAGLAPGMTGIYQIDIRLPDPLPQASTIYVECQVSSSGAHLEIPVRP